MSKIIISCDGGSRIKQGIPREHTIGGFGVVMVFGEHRKEIHEGHLGVTNNQMEILAVTRGLEMIKNPSHAVEVQSDSAYVVNAITQDWIKKWMTNGWLKSNKQPVENVDLWKNLINQIDRFNFITFTKVKGHSGDELNERADRLANIAMDQLTKELQEKSSQSKSVQIDQESHRQILFNRANDLGKIISKLSVHFQNKQESYDESQIKDFIDECDNILDSVEGFKSSGLKLLNGGK